MFDLIYMCIILLIHFYVHNHVYFHIEYVCPGTC